MNRAKFVALATLIWLAPMVSIGHLIAAQTEAISAPAGIPESPSKTAMYALHLSRAIQPDDLTRYSEILVHSEAQKRMLQSWYESNYIEGFTAIEQRVPELMNLSRAAVSAQIPGRVATENATLYQEFMDFEKEINDEIVALDKQLFDFVTSLLADSQLELLPRVLSHRQRSRCTHIGREIHASKIDLCEIVESNILEADVRADIDAILAEYELYLTPLTVRLDALLRKWSVDRFFLLLEHQSAGMDTDEKRKDFLASVRWRTRPISDLQKRIARLNLLYLQYLLDALPPEAGDRIKDSYLKSAYPQIFPDPERPDNLYQQLLADEQLLPEFRELAIGLWQDFHDQYEVICQKLKGEHDRWLAQVCLTEDWSLQMDHRDRMQALLSKRRELNEKFGDKLLEIAILQAQEEEAAR